MQLHAEPWPSSGQSACQSPSAILAPRLQRAVHLLRLTSLEFTQWVDQAIASNPFLEFDPSGDRPFMRGDEADSDILGRIEAPQTLAGALTRQVGCLRLSSRDQALCRAVIDCLDDDGYLRMPLREVMACAGAVGQVRPSQARLALRRVQSLEPAGVGARDLRECLLLQLLARQTLGVDDDRMDLARRLVRFHLPALAGPDPVHLAAALHVPVSLLRGACALVRSLDPRPGWRVGGGLTPALLPDVVVRRKEGRWLVSAAAGTLPTLHVNEAYSAMLARSSHPASPALGAQLQEARFLARQTCRRAATILAVARAILVRQERFLTHGPIALRPLALREIGQALGLHDSTVSRATQGKYIDTPAGLFELRYFFSRGLSTSRGMDCSPAAVRALVGEIIAMEPPGAPLSDVALASALRAQGLQVARRTVTKYRQQLRIEPAPRRQAGSLPRAP